MGRNLHAGEWMSLTWRSAVKDQRTSVGLELRGVWPNSKELYNYVTERVRWCNSDECAGMWTSDTYTLKEWDDDEQEDAIRGSKIVFRFTDPTSAMAFKLRWC